MVPYFMAQNAYPSVNNLSVNYNKRKSKIS